VATLDPCPSPSAALKAPSPAAPDGRPVAPDPTSPRKGKEPRRHLHYVPRELLATRSGGSAAGGTRREGQRLGFAPASPAAGADASVSPFLFFPMSKKKQHEKNKIERIYDVAMWIHYCSPKTTIIFGDILPLSLIVGR
jgi:hypothetical protein